MKKLFLFTIALTALALAGSAFAMHHEVKAATKDGVGNYLTDTEGNTLYWFKSDSPGKSACSGGCVEKWPLYFRKTVGATGDLKAADFATIMREDGKEQSTFRGYPLYYFAGDKKAGDTTGHKARDVWFVIDPANFPPK